MTETAPTVPPGPTAPTEPRQSDEWPTTEDPRPDERVLVTGYPAFTARRMIRKLLATDPSATVVVLARKKFAAEARVFLDALREDQAERAEVVAGDVCDMDLGLSGSEYKRMVAELTTIHHMAGIYYMGVDKGTAERVNIAGTRGVIELAGESQRLRRLCHWSTTAVSGKRRGVVLEEELDQGQSFGNFYEETKYQAELLARAAQRRMPLTIFRPGLIVGHSESGEIDKFDGPYYLMVLLVTNSLQVHLPLPARGAAPLHIVPVDYVMNAGYRLALDARGAGKTFHLVDPNPLSARKVYELAAEHARTKAPRGFIPKGLARTLLRAPGMDRLTRGPLAFLESLDRPVFYNSLGARAILDEAGIFCPAVTTYIDKLVRYVREVHNARREELDDDVFDPFD